MFLGDLRQAHAGAPTFDDLPATGQAQARCLKIEKCTASIAVTLVF
jgi:hypothetical protein